MKGLAGSHLPGQANEETGMTKYHLARKDKEISGEKSIGELLVSCRLAFVSMCRENEPYIVTMNYGYDPERNALYFHCANRGQKLDFINENPAVCAFILRDHGYVDGKCEHRYQSLVIRGKMSVVEELKEKKHGIDVLMDHQESDSDPVRKRNFKVDTDYDIFSILRIDIEEITGKESL